MLPVIRRPVSDTVFLFKVMLVFSVANFGLSIFSFATTCSVEGLAAKEALAFDHADIVDAALQRLRNKVEYTSIPVHLLAPEVTLSDPQRVYETILGRPVEKSAFRKRIKEGDFLEEVPGKQRHGSNRPAQIYRLRDGQQTVYFNRVTGAGGA